MQQAMRVMEEPKGPSLVEQARLVARMRAHEFQQAASQAPARPAQFELWRVLAALGGREALRQVQAVYALQEFMHAPGQLSRRLRGRLHEMVTVGDMNTVNNSARDYIDKFLITDTEMDDGWRQLFTTHDQAVAEAQANKSGFRVLSLESGITFKERQPGEAIEFRKITGSENWVLYRNFGGGIAIDRIFWDDQDYLTMGDLLTAFRAAAYGEQSDNMYALLTSLSTDYNFNTGADLIAKMNGAAAAILRGLQGKDVGASAGSTFLVVHAPERKAEVVAALATMSDVAMQTATSKTKLVFHFKPLATVRVPASGSGSGIYVGLPGGKSKAGIRQDLTLYGQFNIARYADDLAGFLRYNGVLEAAQWRRIP
jgi:hypothetical protein